MVNRDIVTRISGGMRRNLSNNEIYQDLLSRGYSDLEINEAKNFVSSGEKIPKENYSLRKYKSSKILSIFWIITSIVFVLIIFGAIFSDIGEKKIIVSSASLENAVFLDLKKENVVIVENFSNRDLWFRIDAKDDALFISGDVGNFSLSDTENKEIDVDEDGLNDLEFEYINRRRIKVKKVVPKLPERKASAFSLGNIL